MILRGDCLEQMKLMPASSVDSVVTDPPYGWRFMGKAWDGADIDKMAKQGKRPGQTFVGSDGSIRKCREYKAEAAGKYDTRLSGNQAFQVFSEAWAREAFRILKPGGHMLVFCGPRTYHRMASGVEDAGFEIRDQMQWLFGSGFPKSHDISKAIDKQAGAIGCRGKGFNVAGQGISLNQNRELRSDHPDYIAPEGVTAAAIKWQGWGTALKPANEPIVLARKPLAKGLTVAANVLKYGTGALNIDRSRISTKDKWRGKTGIGSTPGQIVYGKNTQIMGEMSSLGRWPANILFDEEAAAVLDEQSGTLKSGALKPYMAVNSSRTSMAYDGNKTWTGDATSGGASRFFYMAKASKRERNAGLEGIAPTKSQGARPNSADASGKFPDHDHRDRGGNNHPTVKPTRLMEYLVRLVTPPCGIVLDPFMGSGSTGVAAKNLGFKFIGIEMNEEYCEIAKRRISGSSAS